MTATPNHVPANALRRVRLARSLGPHDSALRRNRSILPFSMKKPSDPLEEPGPQVFWKVTLTIVSLVAGGLGALHIFGVL